MVTMTEIADVSKAPVQESEVHPPPTGVHGQTRCFTKDYSKQYITRVKEIRMLSHGNVVKEKEICTFASRLEAVNQRLRTLSTKNALELGAEANNLDETALDVVGTEDVDLDSTVSEESLPARRDPWPGYNKRAKELRGNTSAALLARLDCIHATLQSTEREAAEEVLCAKV